MNNFDDKVTLKLTHKNGVEAIVQVRTRNLGMWKRIFERTETTWEIVE